MPRTLKLNGHIAERAFNKPLLIEATKSRIIANFLEKRFNMHGDFVGARVDEDDGYTTRKPDVPSITMDQVAVVSIIGTLVHRMGDCDAASGLMSYQALRECIIEHANNSAIKMIVLDIDSGGGEVDGNFELARLIREINDDVKPVIGIANGVAYSGAYSLGCAAGKLFMIETGGVGSIGVIVQHVDFSKANEAEGIKITNITAGARKAMLSPDFPLSEQAQALLQDKVDQTYNIFVQHVAMMRNISVKDVESTQGGLIFGEDAVKLNLVDGIVDYDDLIENLVTTALPVGLTETRMRIEDMAFLKKDKIEGDAPATPEVPAVPATAPAPKPEDELPADPAPGTSTEDPVERAAAITEVCNSAGMAAEAPKFIRSQMSVAQVKLEADRAGQISAACKLAGKPDRAAGFIASGKALKIVQNELVAEMSAAQVDISNQPTPDQIKTDLEAGKNYVLEDAERRAAQSANKK